MSTRPDKPVPGFYKVKMVRGGPWVPVMIGVPCPIEMHPDEEWNYLDRGIVTRGENATYYRLIAKRGDKDVPVEWVWPGCAGNPIGRKEYEYLLNFGRYAVAHEPDLPEATPEKRVDLGKLPPIRPE